MKALYASAYALFEHFDPYQRSIDEKDIVKMEINKNKNRTIFNRCQQAICGKKLKHLRYGRQDSTAATKEVYRTCATLPFQEI